MRKKKTPKWNFSHEIEPIDTDLNHFCG
jgi:hypothetical protein